MIRRLKYHEIDFVKYTQCLDRSEQRKYTATRHFLDITSKKQWEVLVYKDYEAVMPVPFIRKYGVKIVHNPKLCQQLGVFSEQDHVELNEIFLDYLEKNYLISLYQFNDSNRFQREIRTKKNFLIYPDIYDNVFARYSPKRKRKLRLDEDSLDKVDIRAVTYGDISTFIKTHVIGATKDEDLPEFIRIYERFYELNRLRFSAFYYNNEIINAVATYSDCNTVALLGTFNDKNYVKLSGASILIDKVIQETIETCIFDFEGSELPNIEEFFRGFRPELKPYGVIENSKENLLKKLGYFFLTGKSFL
ncbi:hypothetical protein C1637_21185 [Chryseobacterium lactis]|uniref:GNAT family N-acetyltransferase n=1 Tax=Chryseobacterium lactis TaxID=1241981 RepID=A0A3G6RFG9_CHRLC|nr:hypothetical protein [Chryseobacterium lactis]AZA83417.1 hypothetical protein EG342_16675 [Chryseobacterium lactis]AZB03801.1 hypothetical protein EG341_07550 [Chryseobacterium lactis]PNW11622.1 hypothetical protein C1637_21185 [Chryseobacterium lactis]